MSYPFNVCGVTVADAVAAIGPQSDAVVAGRPLHAKDRDTAIQAATAMAGLVGTPADDEAARSASGAR